MMQEDDVKKMLILVLITNKRT